MPGPWLRIAACAAALLAGDATRAQGSAPPDPDAAPPANASPAAKPADSTSAPPTTAPTTPPPPATDPADAKSGSGEATAPKAPSSVPPAVESARDRARAEAEATLRRELLPQPIEPASFSALLTAIDPSLTANAGLVESFAAYTAALKAVGDDPGRRIMQLAPAGFLFDGTKESFVPRATPELLTLLSLRETAVREAEKAERALFVAVEAATPGESRRRFAIERLRLEMGRMPTAALLPSTTLSIADLVAKLRLSPEAMLAIGAPLDAYVARMTLAARERRQLLRDNAAARATIETDAGTLWRYGDEARVDEIAGSLDLLEDDEFAQELSIRDLQFESLARMRARLGAQDARRLVESFQRALHPDLFEDERVLARIAEDLLALPSLDAERTRTALDVLELSYQRLEPLGRTACEAADLILPRVLAETRDDGEPDPSGAFLDEIRGRVALIDVQRKRRIALKESLQRLRALLGDDSAVLAARFDDLSAAMAAMERADLFERRSLLAREAEIVAVATAADDAGDNAAGDAAGTAPKATPASNPPAQPQPPAPDSSRSGRGSRRPFRNP